MKQLLILVFGLVTLSASAQHDLKVKVSGIKKVVGELNLTLSKEGVGYMNGEKAARYEWVEVSLKPMSYTFKNLEPGKYAVVVIQDLNDNRTLDTNFMRIPKEPYGFSNNPSTTFGPPDFEGASFEVRSDTEIEVRLK